MWKCSLLYVGYQNRPPRPETRYQPQHPVPLPQNIRFQRNFDEFAYPPDLVSVFPATSFPETISADYLARVLATTQGPDLWQLWSEFRSIEAKIQTNHLARPIYFLWVFPCAETAH